MLLSIVSAANLTVFAAADNSASLTIGADIEANYYVDVAYYSSQGGAYLTYAYNEASDTQNINEVTSDPVYFNTLNLNEKYQITQPVAAAQLAEPTVITIFKSDNTVLDTVTYSAKSYCDSIINMTPDQLAAYTDKGNKLVRLCKSIVAYSKTAQALFADYMSLTDSVSITEDYTSELAFSSASYTPSITRTAGDNVSFSGVSFFSTSSSKMRFYLSADEADTTLYNDPVLNLPAGADWEKGYVMSNGLKKYYIQVNNILPDDYDTKLSVSYAGATIEMSVLDYAGTVISSATTSKDAKEFARALIVYNACTEAYFNSSADTNIEVKLPNTGSYLYRIGNYNSVALSWLFKAIDANEAIDSTSVKLTITNIAGTAAGTFTANNTDWTQGTVKFTGTGVVQLVIRQEGAVADTLYLEVVDGENITAASLSNITSRNAVLLRDVNAVKVSLKKILYGNGFTVTDARTSFAGAGNAYITMNDGATLDNAILLGAVYQAAVTSGSDTEYFAPGLWITGSANVYNSYVSETKNAVQVETGDVVFENSTFSGGALANVSISGGNVTLKNCITSTTTRGGIKGIGVRVATASCKINIEGTFTQYNFLKSSDLPSTYSSLLSSVYNDSTYAYTYNGSKYVNMGILFFTDSGSITMAQAQAAVNDNSGNNYGYIEKSVSSYKGTVYTMKSAGATPSLLESPEYFATVCGQHPIPPTATFDYTNKNYIPKTAGDNNYCYYDTTTKSVEISFDKVDANSSFTWDPMILTLTKNGATLPYTVSMNSTNYTNSTISFADSGNYQVVYSYTDPYNYGYNGQAFSVAYTKTVNINVSAVEPDTSVYYASFSYDGAAGNYSAKQVIGTDNKTYVMPNVSSTSTTIGSTTVAGQTVYYPIVSVSPTDSGGNSAYSSGKGYYFAPVFSELHIIDYNQTTGEKQYEYSKSTTTWPHGNSATTGPNTAYFTCASGEKTFSSTSPYARSMNSQYYKYAKNNLGVCYTSNDIEKDNTASNHLVQYHYVSNDGTTYYYYVYYKFAAMTYSSCVADGTLITMADGTKKPVEDVQRGDMVLTWSFWNGCYEAQPVSVKWYHGTEEQGLVNLSFSDGSAIRVVGAHGFFNLDENEYVYITEDNVEQYLGDRFVKLAPDGSTQTVTLDSFELTRETVGSYSLQTAYNDNFVTEDILSITAEDHKGRFEYFEVGDGMKYDEASMQADIETYGLYTADDFAEYLTPMEFDMFNGKYFKVLVGRGVLTEEDILRMIEVNLGQ